MSGDLDKELGRDIDPITGNFKQGETLGEPSEKDVHDHEFELTPEVEAVLVNKRDEIVHSEQLVLRFMNIDEYRSRMDKTGDSRGEVTVTNDFLGMLENVRNGSGNYFLGEKIDPQLVWSCIGSKLTDWPGMDGFVEQKELLKHYRDIHQAKPKEERSISNTRIEFVVFLKDLVKQSISLIYRKDSSPYNDISDSSTTEELLLERTRHLSSITRKELLDLLSKTNEEFTSDDIRKLMLYARINDHHEAVNYQILTIWSPRAVDKDSEFAGWTSLVIGNQNEKELLATLPLINNNELISILKGTTLTQAQGDSQMAHLVLDISANEIFPSKGNDLVKIMEEERLSEQGKERIAQTKRKAEEYYRNKKIFKQKMVKAYEFIDPLIGVSDKIGNIQFDFEKVLEFIEKSDIAEELLQEKSLIYKVNGGLLYAYQLGQQPDIETSKKILELFKSNDFQRALIPFLEKVQSTSLIDSAQYKDALNLIAWLKEKGM